MFDETVEYVKGKTNFATKFDDTKSIEMPSVMLCPKPIFKPSMVDKYQYKRMPDLTYDSQQKYFEHNFTIWQMFEEMTYKLESDLQLQLWDFENSLWEVNQLIIGKNEIGDRGSLEIIEIATYRHGMCLLIKNNLDQKVLRFALTANPDMNMTDTPKSFTILLADQNTWHGMVDDDWPNFRPTTYELPMKPNHTKSWNFKLRSHETVYLEGIESPSDCQRKILVEANCSKICFPLTLNYIDLPPCETYTETQCIVGEIYVSNGPLERKRYHCLKPIKMTEFHGEHFKVSEDPSIETMVFFSVYFYPTKKEVREEVYVLNGREYIGYIGGSLGLLLGFSCYTYIAKFIDKILDNFISTKSDE